MYRNVGNYKPESATSATFAKIVKSADQTVNNSTTLVNDSHLVFTPAINKT